MIRVAHILDTPGPGGAENVLISLVRDLDPTQFESYVCVREQSWMHQQLGNGQIKYHFLTDARALDLRLLRKLVAFIKSNKIDIVHSHEFFMNVYGTAAASVAGIPGVATIHGQVDYAAERLRRRVAYRWVAKQGHLVTVADSLAGRLANEVGVRQDRIHTIHNGIAPEIYQASVDHESLRRGLRIPGAAPVVGMVGNLYPVKGHEYFIRAMASVKKSFSDAVFLVCGRGELQEQLEALAAECGLGDQIRFLGFRDDVPALLRLMDVFVLSSLSEGLSLSIIEAMAGGAPVVVTDVGGNREIVVEGETGFVVPARDPEALADKVCLLLRDRALAKKMGGDGRRRVESLFSQERMVREYERLYLSLVEKRKGRR